MATKKIDSLPYYIGIINKSKTDQKVRLFDNALRSGINLNNPSIKITGHSDLGYLRLLTHVEKTGIKSVKIQVRGLPIGVKKLDIIDNQNRATGASLTMPITVNLKRIKGKCDKSLFGVLKRNISHETLWIVNIPKNSEIELFIYE